MYHFLSVNLPQQNIVSLKHWILYRTFQVMFKLIISHVWGTCFVKVINNLDITLSEITFDYGGVKRWVLSFLKWQWCHICSYMHIKLMTISINFKVLCWIAKTLVLYRVGVNWFEKHYRSQIEKKNQLPRLVTLYSNKQSRIQNIYYEKK